MATKKKTKAKAKAAKKTKGKTRAPKRAGKSAARKAAPKKSAPKKSAKPTAARAAAAPQPPVAVVPPPGERVGTVVHYYGNLSVAIIELDTGALKVGDTIHIKGHTTDFQQPVESMEIDHVHVN